MNSSKNPQVLAWSLILPSIFFISIWVFNWLYQSTYINLFVFIGLVLLVLLASLIKLVMLAKRGE
ncbi:MAG: hypothetical protein QE271_01750 [Bacteriovoracaceae bacterium]|nr:hypothetical protein [Bacteriovoracaceae bacterium]